LSLLEDVACQVLEARNDVALVAALEASSLEAAPAALELPVASELLVAAVLLDEVLEGHVLVIHLLVKYF
jgi:hypothetical protein